MTFPTATLDGDALRHNLAAVRRLAPDSRVLAVIKANAYGHGIVEVARALATADAFGVARIGEGLTLRAAGITGPIVLLEGVFSAVELQQAAAANFELVVHSLEQVSQLEQSSGHRFDVWLKLNTGMNRLGVTPDEFSAARQRLQSCAAVGRVRLMTHLFGAEETGGAGTQEQIARFLGLAAGLNLERSIANSAGLIVWPEARTEWVRPGLMLYGISPLPEQESGHLGLRPAMTLTTQLIAVRRVPTGEGVGYNAIWRAGRDSLIGIAAIGYGDGYARNVGSGAPALVNGHPAQIAGRVSMDMTAIDVSDVPNARIGDTVVLWGEGVPAERVAPYADTIAYELVCGITQRVTRVWKNS
ncbi:alanine racemase [Povalibacter sp.]|uniref:alanine racemase n=1 Tax=Povalibacter sp. TaxID=1962978 RepID=UPI002F4140FD